MDAFDDAFGESPTSPPTSKSNGNGNGSIEDEAEADPAAEFLAREQSNFAGLEDDIPDVPELSSSNGGLTNGNGITDNDNLEDFGIGNGNNGDEFISQDRPPSPFSSSSPPTIFSQREEPEKIRIWREGQKTRLEEKDAQEEENKEKLREAAKKELDDWYKNYDEQISKTRNTNRTAEQEGAAADTSPVDDGKEWEKIATLCDFKDKSRQQKDISRMRSLILQLKQNPPTSRRQSNAGSSNSS